MPHSSGTLKKARSEQADEEVVDAIFTIPNVISFIRLCMVPVFLLLLFGGNDVAAAILFGIASGTDFVDGQIARRTRAVSKLGQILDPAVDRILMITAVLGLLVVGRMPLWIIVLVIVRDLSLLAGGALLLARWRVRVPVIFPGKVATTFLFAGFAGLLLNTPRFPGLGVVDAAWLPGLNAAAVSWGIWLVYIGLVIGAATTVFYVYAGVRAIVSARREGRAEEGGGLSAS
ncbi:MAG: CDP-alcohol phosphatidyltransferase family protein [Berryella intestinalis]|uniref:CDP-alcohol phosphatidyltransferase family protein n=1 Tax=Berryella intestinalis TaxID=1531429 RepID=UPI002A520401|nr:CDP-alcohol phosphatidyltransferase family protein [Berryella intestinalis]MDD7368687.1 CDP-alcohol phosphatidyltransferase family protein [Berryella intestinalis]MDY3129038.1 CDP-alcohol phosphatidyltransferase family protein [Berryella intestinalis]